MNQTAPALSAKTTDIDLVATAKLMRRHLAGAFPGIKFSVRTSRFAGGSSADVSWTDGPTDSQVTAVVKAFAYGGFDGMTDSSYFKGSWYCTEHGASFRHNGGGAGTVPGAVGSPCCLDAEPVEFSAKWVGTRRSLSDDFRTLLVDDLSVALGVEVVAGSSLFAHIDRDGHITRSDTAERVGDLVHHLAGLTAVTAEREIRRVAR